MLLGPALDYPPVLRQVSDRLGYMAAMAVLRQESGSAGTIRRWGLAGGAVPGAGVLNDAALLGEVERQVVGHRLLILYIPEQPRPMPAVLPITWAAPVQGYDAPLPDAMVKGMSARERVFAALGRCGRYMDGELKKAFDAIFTLENAAIFAGFFIAGVAANTNPITGAIFDSAMAAFTYYLAGRAGLRALVVLADATVDAMGAETGAALDAAAEKFAKAFVGLGGAAFLFWLARRIHKEASAKVAKARAPEPVEPPAPKSAPRELEPAERAPSHANEIGILRDAARGKGNFGLGSATAQDAARLGEAWVGKGYKVASDGKTLISADGLKQYRPPSFKPRLGITQANFEQRFKDAGQWQGNGHLDIVP